VASLRYWDWSDSGGVESRRWFVDQLPWTGLEAWEFMKCKPFQKWTTPTVSWRRRPKFLEDMPWTIDSVPLVSDRFKRFLEEKVPGHAQFLPLRMEGPGVDDEHRFFWAVNWLKCVDCLDLARSMNEYSPEEGGGVFKEWTVIDPHRIPVDVVIGRLDKGGDRMSQVLIRDDLRRAIISAGFTGPQFYGVWHSDDPGAPAPLWSPTSGRVDRDAPAGPWPGYR
jgi:hypothetical protein